MNGATPVDNSTSRPNIKSTTRIGISHHFLFV